MNARSVAGAVLILGCLTSFAVAQETGTIVGRVVDQTGGVLPGVTIELVTTNAAPRRPATDIMAVGDQARCHANCREIACRHRTQANVFVASARESRAQAGRQVFLTCEAQYRTVARHGQNETRTHVRQATVFIALTLVSRSPDG